MAGTFAQADVKIVSHMHGTALGRAIPEHALTAYYKGDMMRQDVKDMTTIIDGKLGKVFVLNNVNKTYTEGGDLAAGMQGMKIDATAQVAPTDEHKTIAGHATTKYTVNFHMTITGQAGMTQPMDMSMELWTASDVKTPYVPMHIMRAMG